MSKILVKRVTTHDTTVTGHTEHGCEYANDIINDFKAFGGEVQTAAEAFELIFDTAKFIVSKLGLKDGSPLAASLSNEKLLGLIDDNRPMQLIEKISKYNKNYPAALPFLKEGTAKFKAGKFTPDLKAMEVYLDKYNVYAVTDKDKKAYKLLQEIMDGMLQVRDMARLGENNRDLNLPFAYYRDGKYQFNSDWFVRHIQRK